LKAIVARRYGSAEVLRCEDIETPRPAPDEVLIRVRAAGLNALDWRLMRGEPFLVRFFYGLRRPKYPQPGRDVAGVVEAVGADVSRIRPGDAVFGLCRGAFAEFAVAKETLLAAKPAGVPFEQAAVCGIAGITALQGLRDHARLRAGQTVLVNGAMGGVGQFAVQIAKATGATVTGVCSTHNVDAVRAMGADAVIDYTRDDFTRGEARYDLIFDTIGNHPAADCARVLAPNGACVIAGVSGGLGPFLKRTLQAQWQNRRGPQRFGSYVCRENGADIEAMRELLAAGKVAPVIDRRYRLEDAADAVRYVEAGHARGKVVLAMEGHGSA
jgi:NADPH:quinone reductase-like Zn-dependent oxidoreductase